MKSDNKKVMLEYKGYYIPEIYTFEEHGKERKFACVVPIGKTIPVDTKPNLFGEDDLDYGRIIADSDEELRVPLIWSVERELIIDSIPPDDPIWDCEWADDLFVDGDHRIQAICEGKPLTIRYKYAGVTKWYHFWMGEDSNIHVKVKYPDSHEETVDAYHDLECKYALLAGRVIEESTTRCT